MASTLGVYGRERAIGGSGVQTHIAYAGLIFEMKGYRGHPYKVTARNTNDIHSYVTEIWRKDGYALDVPVATDVPRSWNVGAIRRAGLRMEDDPADYAPFQIALRNGEWHGSYAKLAAALDALVAEEVVTPQVRAWLRQIDLVQRTYWASKERQEREAADDEERRTTVEMGITLKKHLKNGAQWTSIGGDYHNRDFRARPTGDGAFSVTMQTLNDQWDEIATFVRCGDAFFAGMMRFPSITVAAEFLIRDWIMARRQEKMQKRCERLLRERAAEDGRMATDKMYLDRDRAERDAVAARFGAAEGA